MNGYEYLRIAIILQLKKDYYDGLIDNKQLWNSLHSEWMMFLLGSIHPDEAYRALVRRKHEHFIKIKKDI